MFGKNNYKPNDLALIHLIFMIIIMFFFKKNFSNLLN